MALRSLLASVVLLSAAATALAGFEDVNPIQSVTDRFDSIEPNLLHALGNTRHAFRFARFARRYGKRYRSVEEIRRRFGVFVENLELIRSTNRKALPYTLGINQFADLTWEEFRATKLGAAQNCSATLKGNHKRTVAALPDTKDWREEGIVSPVKNQGSCGSCWTFRWSANQIRDFPQCHVTVYCKELDDLRHNQVTLLSYTAEICEYVPELCLDGQGIYISRVPVISWTRVEWYIPDRVLRQFGFYQHYPLDDMEGAPAFKRQYARGKHDTDWYDYHMVHMET